MDKRYIQCKYIYDDQTGDYYIYEQKHISSKTAKQKIKKTRALQKHKSINFYSFKDKDLNYEQK